VVKVTSTLANHSHDQAEYKIIIITYNKITREPKGCPKGYEAAENRIRTMGVS